MNGRSIESERSFYDHEGSGGRTHRTEIHEARASDTAALMPPGAVSVLDLGCGGSMVADRLVERGKKVVGLDIAAAALRFMSVPAVLADAASLPFRDGSYDCVLAAEVVEHLPAPVLASVILEMRRVTRRWLVITVPYKEVIEARQSRCADCGCVFHPWRHTSSFDERRLKSLVGDSFHLTSTHIIGRPGPYISKRLAIVAQAFGGYYLPGVSESPCPSCGNDENFVHESTFMTRLAKNLPAKLLPKTPGTWLGAVFDRQRV